MYFPISGVEVSAILLAFLGFIVGVLGGFFGVGGGFLATPMMYVLGVPFNIAVGTDLTHMVGKSIVAAKKHRALGHVDIKLGLIMVIGTIPGIEIGAQVIQYLKGTGMIDLVLGSIYIIILSGISLFVAWESRNALKIIAPEKIPVKDALSFQSVSKRIQAVRISPMIELPESGIKTISVWSVLFIGFITGLSAGTLGVGGGFIRMPALVYILGCPTHVAIGTDLFEIIISASYGSFTHSLKGNVDIIMALVMHSGAAIGAQIGALSTKYVTGPRVRLYFSILPLIGASMIAYELLHKIIFL